MGVSKCLRWGLKVMLIVISGSCFAQTDNIQIQTTQINDHIYKLTYVAREDVHQYASVGKDGILLVDAGYKFVAPKVIEKLRTLGNGKVRLVINTHDDPDHIGGNQYLRDEAIIIAQRNTANRLDNRYYSLPATDSLDRAQLIFDDSLSFWFNGEQVRIIHIPKTHTDGDIIVHFVNSNIVCIGDICVPDKFASIQVHHGGTVDGSAEGIQFVINAFSPDTKFVAGHGRIYSRDDLVKYRDMIVQTRDAVKKGITAGKSVDNLLKDSVLAPWKQWSDASIGLGDDYWVGTLYDEMTRANTRPLTLAIPLTEAIVKEGINGAIKKYHDLKINEPAHYNFRENELNNLGYNLIWHNMIPEAVEIFKLNTEEYPKSGNVFDSYGEALLVTGDTTLAIKNYKKSLKLNPKNTNASDVLKKLGVK